MNILSARRPRQLTLVLAILVAGTLLRIAGLGAWSLWGDEVASLNISAASMADIWRRAQDLNAPLYYLFMHAWQGLGVEEAWLRLPSALAGVLALPLIWRAGAVLWDEAAGMLALGLLAVSPLHVWYAREARMYALACLFAAAALYCYVRLLATPKSGKSASAAPDLLDRCNLIPACVGCNMGAALRAGARHAVGLATATLLAIYTSYSALLLWVAGLALFPALARRLRTGATQVRGFWLAQAAVALGFACYLPVFAAQIATGNLGFLGVGLARVAPELGLGLVGVVIAAGLCAWRLRRASVEAAVWMPWALIVAFLAFTLLAAVPRGFSIKRQALVFWPVLTLAAAWALRRIGQRLLAGATLALALAATVALLVAGPAEDWRAAAAYVSAAARPGDAIYAQSDLAGAAFAHYYRGPAPIRTPAPNSAGLAALPPPDQGTAWLVANEHPALRAEVASLAAQLSRWGRAEQPAAFARFLRVIAYRP